MCIILNITFRYFLLYDPINYIFEYSFKKLDSIKIFAISTRKTDSFKNEKDET